MNGSEQKNFVQRMTQHQNFAGIAIMLIFTFFALWVAQVKGYQAVCEVACEGKGGQSTGGVFSCSCSIPQDTNLQTTNCLTEQTQDEQRQS